jgi:hypothetical protein
LYPHALKDVRQSLIREQGLLLIAGIFQSHHNPVTEDRIIADAFNALRTISSADRGTLTKSVKASRKLRN